MALALLYLASIPGNAPAKHTVVEGKGVMGRHNSFEFGRETCLKLFLAVGILTILHLTPHYSFSQTPPPVTIDGTLQGLAGSGNNAGSQDLSGQDITVTREMGLLRGNNLFHSFGQFNVPTDGSVTFTGPSSIANILSRVTGNDVSNIDGTLASTIENANLYLMNPNGIIFGKNATLDIKGSFYATTANNIELDQGKTFNAVPSLDDDLLTSAPPEAFGFLGDISPAPITIEVGTFESPALRVPAGETFSIVGGNITVSERTLESPSGSIFFTSLGINNTDQSVRTSSGETNPNAKMGTVTVNEGTLFSTGSFPGAGGPITIRAGHLTATGITISSANGNSPSKAGPITISAAETATIAESTIVVSSFDAGGTGRIAIEAGESLSFVNSLILSNSENTNHPGDTVFLTAKNLNISGTQPGVLDTISTSVSNTDPLNHGGQIMLEGQNVTIEKGAGITSLSRNTSRSGDVTIIGDEGVTISGKDAISGRSVIATNTFGKGKGGTVSVQTKRLVLSDGGRIESVTSGGGGAGEINVKATETMMISGVGQNISGVSSPSELTTQATQQGRGNAGTIDIHTGQLTVSQGGQIQSSTAGNAEAGTITIDASSISISDQDTRVSTDTMESGKGGTIHLKAREAIQITDGSVISATSTGTGDAGSIRIEANDAIVMNRGGVTTQSTIASGGNIELVAKRIIRLNKSKLESSVQGDEKTAGGDIMLDPQFVILQNTQILATATSGFGGNIEIDGDVVLADIFSLDPVNLSATSLSGPQFSGKVDIRAPIQNLSESLAPLPDEILKISGLFTSRCVAQKDGSFSSFTQTNSYNHIPAIGRFLPSPLTFRHGLPRANTTTDSKLRFTDISNALFSIDQFSKIFSMRCSKHLWS